MKLAFLCNLYPPYVIGGNEILAHDLVQALRLRGHDVHVLTGQGRNFADDPHLHCVFNLDLDSPEETFGDRLPLTISRFISRHVHNTASFRGCLSCLQAIRPDLIIAWNLHRASVSPLLAARRIGCPVVAHPADKWLLYGLYDLAQLIPNARGWKMPAVMAFKRLIQPILRRLAEPDYLLAVSEFIRNLHTHVGFPVQRSGVTHLGIATEVFRYQHHEHPGSRTWKLMFAGQLWSGKGPQVAIEAMHQLSQRSDLPAAELDIFGGGDADFQARLKLCVQNLGLESRVRFAGRLNANQLAAEYHQHDAFLFCSVWDEPFSRGLIEAFSCGIPTIATRVGGTPEAVRDGETGIMVPADDPKSLAAAVVQLMNNPVLYRRIGTAASEEVRRRWSFDSYVERIERCYFAMIAAPDRSVLPPL